ncbi:MULTISPECIES: glycoside hydrolase family 2 TIM barrel-domain containing protein [unclassified Massilia]|uniref:glycoside hydrolase family 2 TIM barrel-domain containing protein n=1 Tax=unclassified Massilia TaxID=2609279 RepID=UPI000A98D632|nr:MULTISPECIES: glycoside hydrolase family 2 TIM barrel-domain containing protein [unclassified Massilia]
MEYPRPQLRRTTWRSLDGPWQAMLDDQAACADPSEVSWDRTIVVPYPPEARASGVNDRGYRRRVWYKRVIQLDPSMAPSREERLMLHFGAVNHRARVWVNGRFAVEHRGGHSPFSIDVSRHLDGSLLEIVVQAEDDPQDMHKARGKMDWEPEPHKIWYPRSSGIWRTVWIEKVPRAHVSQLRWTADVAAWQIRLDADVAHVPDGGIANVTLRLGDKLLVADRCLLTGPRLSRIFQLPDPGIDDARALWMWSPESPQLIDAEIEIRSADGNLVDSVQSYTALRTVSVEGDRFVLNSRPYYLRMVLDQGYWPDSLMVASSDQLRHDVLLIKRLGFNGVRKHQKSEDPRWLYWCDVLGLCVWGEMPSAYGFSSATVHGVMEEWKELVERDISHPCIVAWVPTNESWGVPELMNDRRQVDFVRALYHMTRALDGTRPVVGNDGWEMPCGDLVCVHDYEQDPRILVERYGSRDAVAYTLQHVQPDRRRLLIDGFSGIGKPLFLSEFGGIAVMKPGEEQGWGYSVAKDGKELLARYQQLMAAVHACRPLSGFCYTQLTDTFLEKNGLLTEDRVPKAPVEALAMATRGPDAHLHDWHLDPLGHAKRWLARRGPDFPIEWTRVGEVAEVLAYPGERLALNGSTPDRPAPDDPPVNPPAGPGRFERRSRGAAGLRPRRKAA